MEVFEVAAGRRKALIANPDGIDIEVYQRNPAAANQATRSFSQPSGQACFFGPTLRPAPGVDAAAPVMRAKTLRHNARVPKLFRGGENLRTVAPDVLAEP